MLILSVNNFSIDLSKVPSVIISLILEKILYFSLYFSFLFLLEEVDGPPEFQPCVSCLAELEELDLEKYSDFL